MNPGDLYIFKYSEIVATAISWYQDQDSKDRFIVSRSWTIESHSVVILLERIKGRGYEQYFWKLLTSQGVAYCREVRMLDDVINVED